MARAAVATGLSSFLQAFSAVDAVGSRRRREKLLAERLDDERAFRAQQIEFAQSREDRSQQEFDETREERELRLEADAIGLNPNSTDEELREAALRSPIAVEAREHRRGLNAFVSLTDAEIESRQATAIQAGAAEEAPAVTAQQSGLSATDPVTGLPSDPRLTREVDLSELEAQAGRKAPKAALRGVAEPAVQRKRTFDMPLDFKTQAEINAMPDKKAAQATRDRQTLEAQELLAGDLSVAAQTKARTRSDSEREILDNEWEAVAEVTNTEGDFKRGIIQKSPSAGVADYFANRSSLSKGVREKADEFMAPIALQARKEQWQILADPEIDPTSRDYTNAKRRHNEAIRVSNAIALSASPAKDAGVRTPGLPLNQEELAAQYDAAMIAAPKMATTLPPNKERQLVTQEQRLTANPAKRLSRTQLNNIYLAAQGGYITKAGALYRATHGGAAPPGEIDTFSHDPTKELYAKTAGGITLIRPARDINETDAMRNLLETAGSGFIDDYFDQWNTDDDEHRGDGYKFAALGIMGRVEDVANANGFSYSNPLDVQRMLTRITQTVLIRDRFNEQWIIGTDVNPEFSEYFRSIEDAIFDPRLDQFRADKANEFFDDFEGLDLQPLGGGDGDRVARFRQALISSNDPRASAVSQGSDEQVLAFMKAEADAGR